MGAAVRRTAVVTPAAVLPAPLLGPAPPWTTSEWINSTPLALADLHGRVVLLEAFQMLCPGCVAHALPQARRLRETFSPNDVAVVGLHTVFEHHAAMTPVALRAFAHEYRLSFPIGVDTHDDALRPTTFTAYGMRGTPTTVLIDRAGHIRAQHVGAVDDMLLAAQVAALALEHGHAAAADAVTGVCVAGEGCR